MTLDEGLLCVKGEIIRVEETLKDRGSFKSTHEGYAVILEELDEAWDEIKSNKTDKACLEMIQVAAMATRFVMDFLK